MLKLGYTVDAGPGWAPIDLNTAGATGLRVNFRNARSLIFVVDLAAAASGTEDIVLTLKEHTLASAGTTQNLPTIKTVWSKSATALAGTESWVATTQAAAATFTLPGASFSTKQVKLAIQVRADELDEGFGYVSLSAGDPGAVARIAVCNVLLTDLVERRDPANLAPTLF